MLTQLKSLQRKYKKDTAEPSQTQTQHTLTEVPIRRRASAETKKKHREDCNIAMLRKRIRMKTRLCSYHGTYRAHVLANGVVFIIDKMCKKRIFKKEVLKVMK